MFKVFFRSLSSLKTLKVYNKFYNKNPRNLELLRYANRNKGWELQFPTKEFYLKCRIVIDKSHTAAFVVHISGNVLLEASTKESCVSSQLHSNSDVSAAQNIGAILADRCLQAGVMSVFFDEEETPRRSEKIMAFCTAMENGGVSLTEPELIPKPSQIGVDYDSITEEERIKLTTGPLVENIKVTKDYKKTGKYFVNMKYNPEEKKVSRIGSYEKVINGMWWNEYYHELTHPSDLPHWDKNATFKAKPVTVPDYIPELGFRYHKKKITK